MAYLIRVNNFAQVDITIKNMGQQIGTFNVAGIFVFTGTTTPIKQTLYNAKGYTISAPGTLYSKYARTINLAPNNTTTVRMYSDLWANYNSGQVFDIIYSITCIETGVKYTFIKSQIYQHII